MTKEKMKIANILYDFEHHEDIEKVAEITQRLGEIGIYSSVSDLEDDGFAPSTPWLDYDGGIYYSHQIDDVIERLAHEHASFIYRGHTFSIVLCESFTSKYNEAEAPRVRFTIKNINSGEKYIAYRVMEATSPTDPLAISQAHQAIDRYIDITDESP